MLTALGRTEELKSHIRMGLNNGLTREQLKEIFLHVGIYAGVPTAVSAVRAAMEDFSKHGSDVLSAATVEEKAAKQIDFAKKSYELAIANAKELAELYSKSHAEALATLSERVSELSDEVKAAIAKK